MLKNAITNKKDYAAKHWRIKVFFYLMLGTPKFIILTSARTAKKVCMVTTYKMASLILKKLLKPHLSLSNLHSPKQLKIPSRYYAHKELQQTPKVSIVTPSFNQGHFIKETIRSVLDQNYPNLEYIVQDGGSKDNTVSILESYANRLAHWESKPDRGQSNAINLGFAHANGEIMAYLNSDDLLLPGAINYVVDYFNNHPDIDVVYGHRILIDQDSREVGRWIIPKHSNKILSWVDYVPQETLFWRRSIWEKAGGKIDENFNFAMDWDLLIRLRDAGARFARLPRFLGAFRVHETQKSTASINVTGEHEMFLLRQRCLKKVLGHKDVIKACKYYYLKHIVLHKLYQLNLTRY